MEKTENRVRSGWKKVKSEKNWQDLVTNKGKLLEICLAVRSLKSKKKKNVCKLRHDYKIKNYEVISWITDK